MARPIAHPIADHSKMDKVKQRKSTRLRNYDYSKPGLYFATICTNGKKLYFKNDKIREATEKSWLEIPNHFENITLDTYVLMPNHIHGIVVIHTDAPQIYRNAQEKGGASVQKDDSTSAHLDVIPVRRDTPWRVPTRFGPLVRKSLSSVINQFKGSVKRWCNKNGFSYFEWQPRYYEHIIRNEKELSQIREYIVNNPLRWDLDAENPENSKYGKKIDIDAYYRNILQQHTP